jgi:PhnB protein
MQLNPYLMFNGACEAAFKYYEKHLGGKIEMISPYKDQPGGGHVPPGFDNKIMHARMSVAGTMLMGSDSPPDYFSKPQGFNVSLSLKDPAEAERIFKALSDNGQVTMPLQKTFWARAFGMCTDQFGIPWFINCE